MLFRSPKEFGMFLTRGMRVSVPYQHQIKMGIVAEIIDYSDKATKEILDILDAFPIVGEETFMLVDKILEKTNDAYAHVFYQAVPSEIILKPKRTIKALDIHLIPPDLKSKFNTKGLWHLKKMDRIYYPILRKLERDKTIEIMNSLKQKSIKMQTKMYEIGRASCRERV